MITQETVDKVSKFRNDRNWEQFHNPKDLAYVVNYCILMADVCDLDTIVSDKIQRNAEKYPVEKAKGSAKKYTEL